MVINVSDALRLIEKHADRICYECCIFYDMPTKYIEDYTDIVVNSKELSFGFCSSVNDDIADELESFLRSSNQNVPLWLRDVVAVGKSSCN